MTLQSLLSTKKTRLKTAKGIPSSISIWIIWNATWTYPGYLLQPLLHEGSISKAYYSCYKAPFTTKNEDLEQGPAFALYVQIKIGQIFTLMGYKYLMNPSIFMFIIFILYYIHIFSESISLEYHRTFSL